MPPLVEQVQQSIHKLDRWLVNNGWAGHDPYDIRGLPFFLQPAQTPLRRAGQRLGQRAEQFFPGTMRRLMRVPKAVNAKGMGLFAEGYRRLYAHTGQDVYLQRARDALQWLEANPSSGYSGWCWGYPFDWQSRVLIPKGTPSSVVTATVGHAFWGFYRMTGDAHYLDVCQGICEFFLHDLHIDHLDDRRICFSYTPVDRFHVHNANLFVAEFLVRIGQEIDNAAYIETGIRAATYALSEQNADGSLCYWGRDQMTRCDIDHYHSGFEIRCLYALWKATGSLALEKAARAYYAFYNDRLYTDQAVPRHSPVSLYPVNIHSLAEAILCQSTMAADFPEARAYLERVIPWTIQTMQHPAGWFRYMIRDVKGLFRHTLAVPYMRWGQAWMLLALATAYPLIDESPRP